MINLLVHEIWSRKIAIVGWAFGLALFGSMYVGIFPQMQDQMSTLSSISLYKSMGMDMGSFEGFIGSAVVQFMAIILLIYAIMAGTQTLAGEEDNVTLELLVTMPIPRSGILIMKALALAATLFIILALGALGVLLTFSLIKDQVATDLTHLGLFMGIMSAWPFLLAYLSLGLFLGTMTPSRRTASTIVTIVAIAGYFAKIIAISLPSFNGVKTLSFFTYLDTGPSLFINGIDWKNMAVLLTISAIFFALAVWGFARRDLTVAMWPWQRAKTT